MMFPNFGNFPAMSDYQLVYQPFRNSWHRSSSQAWNPARVTNHDFGSYLFPQCGAQGSFAKLWGSGGRGCVHSLFRHRARALCQGHWGTGKGVGGGKRGGRVGEAEFSGIWGWAAEIICTCVKSTGVPDSFSNAAFVLICDLVFQRHVRFQYIYRPYAAPTLFSGCSNLFLQANCDLSVKKCVRRLLFTFVNKFRRSHVEIDIAHRHACMHSIKTCKPCTC